MLPLVYAGMFSLSIVGAIIQAVCGFGYGPVNMSVLPYLLTYFQSVALTGLCGSTTSFFVILSSWKHINWKIILPCEIVGLPVAAVAVRLSASAKDSAMVHALGVLLIAIGLYSLKFNKKFRIMPTFRNGCIAGALAGLCSGLFAVGGVPMSIYMIEAARSNDEYRSTINAHFAITSFMTTFMRWRAGVFTAPVMHAYFLSLGALVIGLWIGTKIFHMLDAKKLRTIVYSYLAFSGVLMLFR